ncbi:anthranilate synthase component I [Hypnocyclicus thermotrophus]|uniref:Anthranilate synthase component 1 n=1 Tax=Hypnocyclicus thermotrophus TaxID=1627895 RepID=A0AA46DZJ6_9FUSO|nr:anthranilate synthase component I [Hypnocyclicus thermotrophus]TDT71872.1 anthranilate synthase component I [Hypnocyclicus thermotrophus]
MKELKVFKKKISGDIETPITLYKKYINNDIGILLESRDSIKGRYSFIGKNPFIIVESNESSIKIKKNGEILKKNGRVLDTIKEEIENIKIIEDSSLPFCGGAVGVIGYDIIKQYEKLPKINPDNLNLPESNMMFLTEFIMYDHYHQDISIIVLEDKNNEELAYKRIEEIENIIKTTTLPINFYNINKIKIENEAISNTTKEEFIEMVQKAKKYIFEGDIFQVVLSQRWTLETNEHPFNLYRKLRSLNPSPYLFYFNFGNYQVAGSSPEMLVELRGDEVFNCPIAGTKKRGKDEKEDLLLAKDLLNDEKEKAEHIMLVDLARNDMGRISKIGSVKVTEFMKIHYYSHVMHIVSLVEGEKRKDKDAFSILSSFLPAGTLSGAPKIRAMEIIEELEKEKRGIYGGAAGYFSYNGDMDTCIAIRTMIIKDNKVYMQAGAGITSDSNPEMEYEETKNKVKALLTAIKS